jgi:hypothetical protein
MFFPCRESNLGRPVRRYVKFPCSPLYVNVPLSEITSCNVLSNEIGLLVVLMDCAICPMVTPWLLTLEPLVRSQINSYDIHGGRSGTGVGFSPSLFDFLPGNNFTIALYSPNYCPPELCDSPTRQHLIISSVLKTEASSLTRHLSGYIERKSIQLC